MNNQWQRYKELELISESIPEPQKQSFKWMFPLTIIWRVLLNQLAREHFLEKRTEYLERCWVLNDLPSSHSISYKKKLHKLWMLMD